MQKRIPAGFYATIGMDVHVAPAAGVVYDCAFAGHAGPHPPRRKDPMPVRLSLTVNGKPVSADVEPRTLLVDFIRDTLRLTGTHIGCDTAQCGACTIHMNGVAVKCCNMLALQAQGATILTIEGLAMADGTMHPMQAAFRDHHGLQ